MKSWNCGVWIYFAGVIKFMKGKVNVKFTNVCEKLDLWGGDLFCGCYQIYERESECESYYSEKLELWGGDCFFGCYQIYERESEYEIYESEKLELWGGDLFCGCYQIYGPAFGGSLIPGFGH